MLRDRRFPVHIDRHSLESIYYDDDYIPFLVNDCREKKGIVEKEKKDKNTEENNNKRKKNLRAENEVGK